MATIKHTDWLNGMLGNWTHSFVDLNGDTIKASLLDQTDSGTITASSVDYADVNTPTVVSTATLTISSITGGVVTLSGTVTFSAVTGDAADYLAVYKDSGVASTSPLVVTYDSATTGLPVTPNGGDIDATWGSNQLITLS